MERLKVLADQTRFNLLKLIINNDLCVGALATRLDISKAAASQHLQALRKAGFVRGKNEVTIPTIPWTKRPFAPLHPNWWKLSTMVLPEGLPVSRPYQKKMIKKNE